MRAILLAAGFGTRLRPVTDTIPKCLVPIHGKPLLQIWLERLSAAGVESFLINMHYLSEQVVEFINESEFRDQVELVHEPDLLGTAGTLVNNIDFFHGEDGLLIHADNYCLADFSKFFYAHQQRPNKCLITMMTFRTDEPSSCGIVELDDKNVVIEFYEKVESPPSDLANGAVYILSHDLIELLKKEYSNIVDISAELLPTLINKIYSHEINEKFVDIGTPERYEQANIL